MKGGLTINTKIKIKLSWGNSSLLGIILILPLVLWITGTVLYPSIRAIGLSFTDVDFLGTETNFVGLKNYISFLKNPEFWGSFGKSIIWTVGNAVVQVILGFATALIINQKFKGQEFAQTWIILPWILPTIVVAIIWRWVLSSTFGVLNYILQAIHIIENPINFLGTLQMAMPTLIFINSWRWFPFFGVIIFAALQTIPQELYEAAVIDGTSNIQKFKFITFPMLRPTLSVLGVVGTLWSINIFDIIWMLTRGGPAGATITLPVFIYKKAFQDYAMSEAATAAVLLSLFLILFIVFLTKIDPSFNEKEF